MAGGQWSQHVMHRLPALCHQGGVVADTVAIPLVRVELSVAVEPHASRRPVARVCVLHVYVNTTGAAVSEARVDVPMADARARLQSLVCRVGSVEKDLVVPEDRPDPKLLTVAVPPSLLPLPPQEAITVVLTYTSVPTVVAGKPARRPKPAHGRDSSHSWDKGGAEPGSGDTFSLCVPTTVVGWVPTTFLDPAGDPCRGLCVRNGYWRRQLQADCTYEEHVGPVGGLRIRATVVPSSVHADSVTVSSPTHGDSLVVVPLPDLVEICVGGGAFTSGLVGGDFVLHITPDPVGPSSWGRPAWRRAPP
jgi:hypothetical protein